MMITEIAQRAAGTAEASGVCLSCGTLCSQLDRFYTGISSSASLGARIGGMRFRGQYNFSFHQTTSTPRGRLTRGEIRNHYITTPIDIS